MSSNIEPETLTPIPKEENELKDNQSYSCTECSSLIEITSLDEINNILSFKCPTHGTKTMTIKKYLEDMKKNTFLYSICSLCKKKQNEINNNEIFNYCTNCKLIICNSCIMNHDREHVTIKNNKNLTICPLHPKNNNISYCLDCNCHICKECMKHRKHMEHKKKIIQEIEPSDEEINSLLKVIEAYKDKIKSSEIKKNNELSEKKIEFNKEKEKEKNDYQKLCENTKKEKENELQENENNHNYEIKEITDKYQKELDEKQIIYENNKKLINNKYENKKAYNKENFEKKKDILEKNYENEKNRIENAFKEQINNFKELLKINDIIYNTYNSSKENYFHNINIINLLVNYYNKGNEIIREMKDNEDFMETIKQREYELNKFQIEDINQIKRDSFLEEKKIQKQNSELILQNKIYFNQKTVQNAKHRKLNSINKSNILIQNIYDNKTCKNAKSKEHMNNFLFYNDQAKSLNEKIDYKNNEGKNDNRSANEIINFQTIDQFSKDS